MAASVSEDPTSYSNPDEAVIRHMDLKFDVDFTRSIIQGEARLRVTNIVADNRELRLDVKSLTIHDVKHGKTNRPLRYSVDPPNGHMGSLMKITLPQTAEKFYDIVIYYDTGKDSSALQWLTPEQTSGKKYPFLFSQCQAIHARSLLPCQDTPAVKFTYTAEVKVPKKMRALMGALRISSSVSGETACYKFDQPVVVPSYLIALAVGDLQYRKIGPRSTVWGEKEIIESAADECSQTETFLVIAEKFCGPYVWGIYDLLVLPPTFPLGGMENPCVTFITPTFLTGDLSNTNVVAHEIAHSWAGNLVTNKNFNHFWLNEGLTVFIERKILGALFDEPTRHFHARLGLKELEQSIATLGESNPLTQLVVDLNGVDPDDAFSTCPYEKGHTFLFYLEDLVGGAEVFNRFIISYIDHFKYQSVDSQDFKQYFLRYFRGTEGLDLIDWDLWFYSPGMPPVIPELDSSLEKVCCDLAQKWIDWDGQLPGPFTARDFHRFTALQLQSFLTTLLDAPRLSTVKLRCMDSLCDFSTSKNSEIKFRWLRLCIKARWMEQLPNALQFLSSTGRMKFCRPIFRDLYEWEEVRAQAIEHYHRLKPSMMHLTAHALSNDLHLTE